MVERLARTLWTSHRAWWSKGNTFRFFYDTQLYCSGQSTYRRLNPFTPAKVPSSMSAISFWSKSKVATLTRSRKEIFRIRPIWFSPRSLKREMHWTSTLCKPSYVETSLRGTLCKQTEYFDYCKNQFPNCDRVPFC